MDQTPGTAEQRARWQHTRNQGERPQDKGSLAGQTREAAGPRRGRDFLQSTAPGSWSSRGGKTMPEGVGGDF